VHLLQGTYTPTRAPMKCDLGTGLEISFFMDCAKRDKGQAFRIGPQEEFKT